MRIFPLRIIKRDDGAHYLKRWTILNLYFIKFRVHHILLSDYDCVHDHPWWFITWIIKGGYFEKQPISQIKDMHKYGAFWHKTGFITSWHPSGSVLFRDAKFQHSIELYHGKTAWTFVIMGRTKRLWGFWHKTLGFIPWFNYHSSQKCD
jgi:hypothetical protein